VSTKHYRIREKVSHRLTAIKELTDIVKIYEITLQQLDDEVFVLNDGKS
jgi:F0F1-type ATP synthase beta subunit